MSVSSFWKQANVATQTQHVLPHYDAGIEHQRRQTNSSSERTSQHLWWICELFVMTMSISVPEKVAFTLFTWQMRVNVCVRHFAQPVLCICVHVDNDFSESG